MSESRRELAWNLFTELRKELVESQKIRTQIIGFKITFVSGAIGLMATHLDKVPRALLALPAFAAIFFDFLIHGYAFSVKRIGYYCREHLEPVLRTGSDLADDILLWERFLVKPFTRRTFGFSGNFGLTILASAIAVIALVNPFELYSSIALLATLVVMLLLDMRAYRMILRFRDSPLVEE
jgi:hypothetical protein